jgi:hypothetical protein
MYGLSIGVAAGHLVELTLNRKYSNKNEQNYLEKKKGRVPEGIHL